MQLSREDSLEIWARIDRKRNEIARKLFSSQSNMHPKTNARSVLALAGQLSELVAKLGDK